MRYLVISDTHGKTEAAVKLYSTLQNIDKIIHLGDYAGDGERIALRLSVEVIAVKGNMDGGYAVDDYAILDTEFGKLYLTHGHMEAVKYGTEKLLYKASSLGCKAALFGHTHVPMFDFTGGMYLFNPGSLTMPRGGNRQGSYGILETGPETFHVDIRFLNILPEAGKKNGGGTLKSLLNNSDRF